MAQMLRLILIALVLALALPAPGAQSGDDPAIWSQTLAETTILGDPPEGGRPCALPLSDARPPAALRRRTAATACRPRRSPTPEARGPPRP
jgi:hypothetical protein